MLKRLLQTIIVLAVLPSTSQAALILWSLDDLDFLDGTTVNGSFVYDTADSSTSDVNVTTADGFGVVCDDVGTPGDGECEGFIFDIPFSGNSYDSAFTFGTDFVLFNDTTTQLILIFDGELGTLSVYDVLVMVEFVCDPDCVFDAEQDFFRGAREDLAVVGTISATSIPEPGTLGLLGAGLIGLAWRRRRT